MKKLKEKFSFNVIERQVVLAEEKFQYEIIR